MPSANAGSRVSSIVLVFVHPPQTKSPTADGFQNLGRTICLLPVHIPHPDSQSPARGPIQDIHQTLVIQNSTSGPYVAPVFSSPYAVSVNALCFASLGVVLVAAFLCLLVKGWIRELDRKPQSAPDLKKRAVIKELREQGLVRWWFREMIAILPSLIHVSLVLFFIGLAVYLLQVCIPPDLTISIFGPGVLVHVLSNLISAIDDFSLFRSPHSRPLGHLYCHLYSCLVSLLHYRFSSLYANGSPRSYQSTNRLRNKLSLTLSPQTISQTSAPVSSNVGVLSVQETPQRMQTIFPHPPCSSLMISTSDSETQRHMCTRFGRSYKYRAPRNRNKPRAHRYRRRCYHATLASALAIARFKLPLDLVVATPMTENMPGGCARKPGDM